MMVFVFFISITLIPLGKAIADITSNYPNWKQSIFSKIGNKSSFWGSKDHTWTRKDHPNPILNYLLHTILVPFTDIWHMANTIRRIGIYGAVFSALLMHHYWPVNMLDAIFATTIFAFDNTFTFHILYHKLLRI